MYIMKYLLCILFFYIFVIVESKNLTKEISFDVCNKDSWWIKNISLTPSGSLINFEANAGLGEEKNVSSSLLKFSLTGCTSNFTCTNHTNAVIDGLNCTSNLTEIENELCNVVKIVEDWTQNSTQLQLLNSTKYRDACILYESVNITILDASTNNKTVESILDPLLQNISQHLLLR